MQNNTQNFILAQHQLINNNIEVTWVHHFGINNNNYSRIMYESLSGNANYSKDYDVIAGDIGVHSLTFTFQKL